MTSVKPSDGQIVKVGTSLSETVLAVQNDMLGADGATGATGPAGSESSPTTERVTATLSPAGVPVSPTIDESFVVSDGNSEPQFVTLANGAADGFQKTITYYGTTGPLNNFQPVPGASWLPSLCRVTYCRDRWSDRHHRCT